MAGFVLERNIGTLIEKASKRYGDKKAICFDYEDISFSFRQLNEKVNQFANVFHAEGIKKGDHVAVMLPNCSEFALSWLALAKIGAAMVPINNRYREVDLEYVLNDSDACALIVDSEYASVYRGISIRTPKIKITFIVGKNQENLGLSLNQLADNASLEFSAVDAAPHDLLNIQYTSGTTGFPKGCMLGHDYWLTCAMAASKSIEIKTDDVFLSASAFYYMDPQWQVIMCLATGCTMVLCRNFVPADFMRLAHQYRATLTHITVASLLLKQPESQYDNNHNLRYAFFGYISPDLHKKLEERFNIRACPAYGMTEIGAGMIVPIEDVHMTGTGTVGKPFEHLQFRIVDEDGKDVKQGEMGELWVKGAGIFQGYYKKEKETAHLFEREWFRTGDLFRQDENGYYYIIGRKKEMIRRSGDNISVSELEGVIISHPKVKLVAVLPVPDDIRGEEVKAYIVPADGETTETIPPDEIMEFCLNRLAKYKVPRYIEYKKELPLTPTGRVMKHILIKEKKDLTSDCYDRFAAGN